MKEKVLAFLSKAAVVIIPAEIIVLHTGAQRIGRARVSGTGMLSAIGRTAASVATCGLYDLYEAVANPTVNVSMIQTLGHDVAAIKAAVIPAVVIPAAVPEATTQEVAPEILTSEMAKKISGKHENQIEAPATK